MKDWSLESEEKIQNEFIRMVDQRAKRDWRWKQIFHTPNGGKRDIRTAKRLKSMGTRKGVLDIKIDIPIGNHCGMWIEFKDKRGKLTKEQEEFAARAILAGNVVVTHRDPYAAYKDAEKYFDGGFS